MYIGVIGRPIQNKICFNSEVINLIYQYNCIPITISPNFINNNFNQIKPLIDMCNGFILQGGSDFYNIDLCIIKYLYDNNIPTLGICLGMQTMAMLFGGNLEKIKYHNKTDKYVHYITINKNSKLYSILKKEKILVNSRHSYCVTKTNLKISSMSNVIESIEDETKKFFIGVQWHPESLMDKNSILLFDNFFFSIK